MSYYDNILEGGSMSEKSLGIDFVLSDPYVSMEEKQRLVDEFNWTYCGNKSVNPWENDFYYDRSRMDYFENT